jgi:cyclopropane fatty-acyl-phospholipid synthase-like methyltransferase
MKSFNPPACLRNQEPILSVFKQCMNDKLTHLFEMGSGTGQHACYIAPFFPNLTWYTSDKPSAHPMIEAALQQAKLSNIKAPLSYEVGKDDLPAEQMEAVFSANTFHILSWEHVCLFIEQASKKLRIGGLFIVYGPFMRDGEYASENDQAFDAYLSNENPVSALRGLDDVTVEMKKAHCRLQKVFDMPANNLTLLFEKI